MKDKLSKQKRTLKFKIMKRKINGFLKAILMVKMFICWLILKATRKLPSNCKLIITTWKELGSMKTTIKESLNFIKYKL